jgi:hypothetical protein
MIGTEHDALLKEAAEHWGIISRYEMLAEECMELALSTHKILTREDRTNTQIDKFCDEMADVKIMLRSIEICSPELIEKIEERVNFKLDRLRQRLDLNEPH